MRFTTPNTFTTLPSFLLCILSPLQVVTPVFSAGNALLSGGCSSSSVPCTTGSIYYSSPILPGSGASMNYAMSGVSVPALGAFVFASATALYAGGDSTTAGTGGLYKYTSTAGTVSGAWTAVTWPSTNARTKNPGTATLGVHGLTGRAEGATYALYLTTSATSQNLLYRYDTAFDASANVGDGFTQLASAPTGQMLMGVIPVPVGEPVEDEDAVDEGVAVDVDEGGTGTGMTPISICPDGADASCVKPSPTLADASNAVS
jgi:hypothetical protein